MEMEMERSSSMSLRVIQQAKEELEMLEAQHPNRFHSLKLDLKSFIFLHSQNLFLNSNCNSNTSSSSPSSSQCPHHKMPSAISSSATTQGSLLLLLLHHHHHPSVMLLIVVNLFLVYETASSNSSRKRKRGTFDDEESNQKFQRVDGDRVDVVLKRAEVCLQKIQDLKTNFFCS
ncbi:hypothetical protein PVL29_004584 [Vitis rotundifolia]|uniref:Uncharacterized protein n=1 Tax=Vitis rotundifolia TaxID=103349 RepID=A0AA39E0M4_VITRO|nr:hypothetical protein PVL29_004584 [Vitis rotundifolia]